MGRYAENTSVSTEQTKKEIERILKKYGANQFMYGWLEEQALIGFMYNGKQVRFVLPLPDKNAPEIIYTPERGLTRSKEQQESAYEKAQRQRWRALALVIKAKLEAVEAGISIFEEEFLANIVLPDNRTVSQFIIPQIEKAYINGQMPQMLPQIEEV